MRFRLLVVILTLLGGIVFTGCPSPGGPGGRVDISGAGATFPTLLYQRWASEYSKARQNVRVDYQSMGSGAGIQQTRNRTVDFGATDAPLSDQRLKEMPEPVVHIPATAGAVSLTYNLPGVGKGLKLTPDVIADIYLGKVGKWNDPRISAANPGLKLPDQDISPVYRSDGSGTTYIFTNYLSAVSDEWKGKVGVGTAVKWPAGQGAKGNEGAANAVRQTPGAFGYVELAYVIQNQMSYAAVKNQAGNFVEPSLESTRAALAAVVPQMQQDVRQAAVNQPGEQSYPIAGFTYLLVYKDLPDEARGTALVNFLWWAIHDGQQYATDLHYVPLPDSVVKVNEGVIRSITVRGKPVTL